MGAGEASREGELNEQQSRVRAARAARTGTWSVSGVFAHPAIGLYAVTLYATLGYLAYTLVSAYLTARG